MKKGRVSLVVTVLVFLLALGSAMAGSKIRFKNMSNKAGIGDTLEEESVGIAFGDYDNDGDQDVYVAKTSSENRLWENDGNGNFIDVAVLRGVGSRGFSRGISWGDYDIDGDLDLIVASATHHPVPKSINANWRT